MLRVELPASHAAERRYVVDVVLRDWLGLEVELVPGGEGRTVLSHAGKRLTVEDGLFAIGPGDWMAPSSLPPEPLARWAADELGGLPVGVERPLPVLYGTPLRGSAYVELAEEAVAVGLDLFGAIFFLLTRYEEVALGDAVRDDRDRFPASAALASREGFVQRPLADEYCELLWHLLTRLWPTLRRRERHHRTLLSHDVDLAFHPRVGPRELLRLARRDVRERADPLLALRRVVGYAQPGGRVAPFEPYNTFGWLMGESERRGHPSVFYFMTRRSSDPIDADYDLAHPFARKLMLGAHRRGHELGLHPSYESYRDPALLARERAELARAAEQLGIAQPRWGARQHYLRWKNPITWRGYCEAGLDYDASLAFHDAVGFRSGTCHEHATFDLERGTTLPLRERPLIAMDQTLRSYMGLQPRAIAETVEALTGRCRALGGEMSVLWHNSSVITRDERRLYLDVLDACGA